MRVRFFPFLAAATALLLSAASAQESAPESPEPPEPLRVLFLGNSYTEQNRLPAVVRALAASARIPVELEVESRTPGGFSFERHWIEGRSVDRIREGGWQVVVLQEQSRIPVDDPLLMLRNGKKLVAEVRKAGARPLLFQTWARRDQPEMIEGLEQAYRGLGEQSDAQVAPVGLAWRDALAEKPHVGLHREDGSHPNARGTYLAACVLLGWIAEVDPRSLGEVGRRELVPEEIEFLHRIASRHVPEAARLPMARGLHAARVTADRVGLRWEKAERRPSAWRVQRRLAVSESEEPEDAGEAGEAGDADEVGSSDDGFRTLAQLKGSSTSWTDKEVEAGTGYEYRVWPVFEEKKLALKAGGAPRVLELSIGRHQQLVLTARGASLVWRYRGQEFELDDGVSHAVPVAAKAADFRAEAAAVEHRCTALASLLPAPDRLAAIPPLRVLTLAR